MTSASDSPRQQARATLPDRGPHLTGGLALVDHPAVSSFARWVTEEYRPPKGSDIGLFLPCAATKPYSTSRTYRAVERELVKLPAGGAGRVHWLTVSEPLGIVPHELESAYPADSYDLTLRSWLPIGAFSSRRRPDMGVRADTPTRTKVRLTADERVAMQVIAERVGRFLYSTKDRYRARIGYVRGTQKWLLKRGSTLAGVDIHFPLDDP